MSFTNPETKWNADDQKLSIVMNIEDALASSFLEWDLEGIYQLLRLYRLQTNPKFKKTIQDEIESELNILSSLLREYIKSEEEKTKEEFYKKAEDLFLKISQELKIAGVYYREGRNASHAILER